MLIYLVIVIFIAIAVGLVLFLLKEDKGEKEPTIDLWLAAGLGLSAAVIAAIVERLVIPMANTKLGTPFGTMFLSFLGVGVIEETLKFLPLALIIYPKKYFNEHTDGIIYFAIAGLGFGLPENILYTIQYGAKAGVGRLVMTPFFHAAITAMVGFYLVRAKLAKKSPFTVWPYFLLAIGLHTLYDFGLASGSDLFTFISIAITLALSANLFYLFFKAKDLDEDTGLAAVGHNSFCRSCGAVNTNHYLYCTQCGKRA
ncbi:MAG: PrsW family intramembrane metalloprotease, partial [Candidatus Saccharibacteria bacterium]